MGGRVVSDLLRVQSSKAHSTPSWVFLFFFFFFYSNHFQKKRGLSWALKKHLMWKVRCVYRAMNGLRLLMVSQRGPHWCQGLDGSSWWGLFCELYDGGQRIPGAPPSRDNHKSLHALGGQKDPSGQWWEVDEMWLYMDVNIILVHLNFFLQKIRKHYRFHPWQAMCTHWFKKRRSGKTRHWLGETICRAYFWEGICI